MKKVAIIGYASNWKEAPFGDPDCEIWIQNIAEILKSGFPRFDKVFDIHTIAVIEAEAKNEPAGLEYVKANNIPVYMQEKTALISGSVRFPLYELSEEFFPWSNKLEDVYWTSTTQMMIALAISQGFQEIGIYGIDMSDSVEYRSQRRGCEYMLGVAIGRGIVVRRSSSSPILRSKFVYGYEIVKEKTYRAHLASRVEYLKQRLALLNQDGAQKAAEKMHLEGALHAFDELEKNWLGE